MASSTLSLPFFLVFNGRKRRDAGEGVPFSNDEHLSPFPLFFLKEDEGREDRN